MVIFILISILILINGYFSAAEIAIVSVKKFKIQPEADKGNRNASQILEYLKDPADYLSTIQAGVTLVGLIEGLYGGEAFKTYLEPKFLSWGIHSSLAHVISIVIGIGFITYVTIIIGELVPKYLALQSPQKIALRIVPSFRIFTFLAYPFVKILTGSSRLLLKLMHVNKSESQNLSDADLKNILSQAYRQGTLEKEELILHENIFNFYEQSVHSMMTPLEKVISIQITMTEAEVEALLRNSPHNYFPVLRQKNKLEGFLCAREFFMERNKGLTEHFKPACSVTGNQKASELLQKFKASNQNFGVVVDEKGELSGLVTMHDIGTLLIGKIP
jgi:putative hemolysin